MDLAVAMSLPSEPRWCWIQSDPSTGGGKRFLGPASTRGKNGLSMTALRTGWEYWALRRWVMQELGNGRAPRRWCTCASHYSAISSESQPSPGILGSLAGPACSLPSGSWRVRLTAEVSHTQTSQAPTPERARRVAPGADRTSWGDRSSPLPRDRGMDSACRTARWGRVFSCTILSLQRCPHSPLHRKPH